MLEDTSKLKKIFNSEVIRKIFKNSGWLISDKILRLGVGLFVNILLARYLGVEKFGILNYALSITAMFLPMCTLGLDQILVKNLTSEPQNEKEYISAGFLLKFLGGTVSYILLTLIALFFFDDQSELKIVLVILSFGNLFRIVDVIDYWYQSKLSVKYVMLSRGISFVVFSFLKILLIFLQADLLFFAVLISGELLLAGILLSVYFKRDYFSSLKLRSLQKYSKNLFSQSLPLIFSGFLGMIYLRIDQVMIGSILDNENVGIYSAAIKLSEIWYFIPAIINISLLPLLVKYKSEKSDKYLYGLQKYFDLMVYVTIPVAVLISSFSEQIISVLYGPQFLESSLILSIHIWTGVFVFIGGAARIWFIAEDLQKYVFYRTLTGATINILLNLLLIPKFHIKGAAVATLISQFYVAYASNLFTKKTRSLFIMHSKAYLRFFSLRYLFQFNKLYK